MAITKKHPAMKLTVGAQYICFNEMDENNDWTDEFESDVVQLPTVVDVTVTDNTDAYESYASGDVYESDAPVTYVDIETTQIAFPDALLARMRGDTIDGGAVLGGGISQIRPYFAYGIVIEKKDGSLDLRWYPKCKLTENSDATATSTDSHSDQTDSTTIRAYGYDTDGNKVARALTGETGYERITEAAFFAAPVLTIAAIKALIPSP